MIETKAEKAPRNKAMVVESAEKAKEIAESRTKGPRRPFTCTFGDKVIHVVAHNEGRAGGVAFQHLGGKVEQIGKPSKAAKPVGLDAILAAIKLLPEAEQKKVKEQLGIKDEAPAPAPKTVTPAKK